MLKKTNLNDALSQGVKKNKIEKKNSFSLPNETEIKSVLETSGFRSTALFPNLYHLYKSRRKKCVLRISFAKLRRVQIPLPDKIPHRHLNLRLWNLNGDERQRVLNMNL